ncbi:MAG: hypothetical protein MUC36_24420 [Planctomycetes bacterium]|nr:hypothetical protein [Planctomycetota bacterium]
MSTPLPDQVSNELRALRTSLDALTARLDQLAATNASLHERLERSEAARTDLLAQTTRIVELLAEARAEIRSLQGSAGR